MSVKTSIVKAKDVMRRDVMTIDGMATVREAATKMRSENVTALVVDKRLSLHDYKKTCQDLLDSRLVDLS